MVLHSVSSARVRESHRNCISNPFAIGLHSLRPRRSATGVIMREQQPTEKRGANGQRFCRCAIEISQRNVEAAFNNRFCRIDRLEDERAARHGIAAEWVISRAVKRPNALPTRWWNDCLRAYG